MQLEANKVISSWHDIAVTIDDFIVDIGQVFSICCDSMFFLDQAYTCWLTCCDNLVAGNFFTLLVTSYSFQSSRLISHFPLKVEFLRISSLLIATTIAGFFFIKFLNSQRLVVQVQFDTGSVGVCTDWYFIFSICNIVCQVLIFPVPVRKQVNHRFLLSWNPLTLVKVVIIFRNTRRVHYSKVRTFHRCVVLVVPRSWLTDIVCTCPNKLSCVARIISVKGPRSGCRFTPANTVISIVRLLIVAPRLIASNPFLLWMEIAATRTSSWRCFRTINQPIWMFST